MIFTCLIMAFKAEEINCNIVDFLSRIEKVEGVDPIKVMEYEISLLEGVKFQVNVYSPFDSLEGFEMAFNIAKDVVEKATKIILPRLSCPNVEV